MAVDGVLYGPASIPAGPAVDVPYTAVSQSAVTGAGTEGDPLRIVTVVDLGATGLRLTQTDSYVIGQEVYRTDVAVANSGASARTALLYRAGDCFLQDSDVGYGSANPATGAVACVTSLDSGARIQQWFPLSPGSHYYEAGFGDVWSLVASQAQFPDTCECNQLIDNGAGLSWQVTGARRWHRDPIAIHRILADRSRPLDHRQGRRCRDDARRGLERLHGDLLEFPTNSRSRSPASLTISRPGSPTSLGRPPARRTRTRPSGPAT